jgi:hypothetical protein
VIVYTPYHRDQITRFSAKSAIVAGRILAFVIFELNTQSVFGQEPGKMSLCDLEYSWTGVRGRGQANL